MTSHKGLILKVNNRSATVGRLSDIIERAYISSFIFNKFMKIYHSQEILNT